MPTNNNTVCPVRLPNVTLQSKDSPVSRDDSNSNCYWLFIFMLKIVKKNLEIAKKMF